MNIKNKLITALSGSLIVTHNLLFVLTPAWAKQTEGGQPQDQMEQLLAMGFEELANIRLTTASRKDQKLSEIPAAVYVIGQEEIRRSGMTSLPELLRMVPGLDVARIDSSNWAVSSRGFNGQFSNKLLVLMDGRTLYTPLFAGVFWSFQDVVLEDVERIEVIRGPGGTMWGANAVNGVINIITKKSRDTQGALVTMGTGNLDRRQAGFRYGGRVNDKLAYRFHVKEFHREDFPSSNGLGDDGWTARHGGGRVDWELNSADSLTMIGNMFHSKDNTQTLHAQGENAQLRWTRKFADTSDLMLQFYYDHVKQENLEERTIYDFDFQNRFPLLDRHEIIWGLGYRWATDAVKDSNFLSWTPLATEQSTYSLFVQDEIPLFEDKVRLTLGSKMEHHAITGWEHQPSARLLWHATEQDTLWTSVSHAVRSPSRSDTGFKLSTPAGPNTTLALNGNPSILSETLTAYELGYRKQVSEDLFLDITGFHNEYDKLITNESKVSFNFPNTLISQTFANLGVARTRGIETGVDWQVRNNWKLRASYTYLNMTMGLDGGSTDTAFYRKSGEAPQHQVQVRSYLDLPNDVALDTSLFYVDGLPTLQIPPYLRWDMRLGWKPAANVGLSLVGQNLLDQQHPEFKGTSVQGREIPRSLFISAELVF